MQSDYEPFQINQKSSSERNKFDDIDSTKSQEKWSFYQYLKGKMVDVVYSTVPSDTIKEYPPEFMFCCGSILIVFVVLFFLGNFVYLFQTNLGTVFLSPRNGADSTSICTEITSANTGTFYATKTGIWTGLDGFDYTDAVYMLTTTNFRISEANFGEIMGLLYDYIHGITSQLKYGDLAVNLLMWFSFAAFPNPDNPSEIRFSLLGDPTVVFDRQFVYGTISSQAGECILADQTASMDVANGNLILNIPIQDYYNDPICYQAGNLAYLGANPFLSTGTFQMKIDVRSLMTAMAVNYRILPLTFLSEIKSFRQTRNGAVFSLYYDPKYAGMDSILCITQNTTGDSLTTCSVRMGVTTLVLPFFHHVGRNDTYPERCLCADLTDAEISDPTHKCNLFNFLVGFIFFPVEDNIPAVVELMLGYGEYYPLHYLSYEASFTASAYGFLSPYYPLLSSPENRAKMYSFCSFDNYNCSMVTFTLGNSVPDWSVSKYYYQLFTGACQDSITPPREIWQKLIDQPFSALVQEYTQCSYKPTFVFLTQLGSAFGAMDILIPFAVLITSAIVYCYQRFILHDEILPETYSKEEKESAISALATSLLLTRDHLRYYEQQKVSKLENVQSLEMSDIFPKHSKSNLSPLNAQEKELYEHVIYPFVKTLSKDSIYHSNPKKLREILDLVAEKIEEENKYDQLKQDEIVVDVENRIESNRNTFDENQDLPLRVSRGITAESSEEIEFSRLYPLQKKVRNVPIPSKSSDEAVVERQESSSMGSPDRIILNHLPNFPLSSSESTHKTYTSSQEIIRKLKEIIFIFQKFSSSNSTDSTSSKQNLQRLFDSISFLDYIDESCFRNHVGHVENEKVYYSLLYELLLTHIIVIMNNEPEHLGISTDQSSSDYRDHSSLIKRMCYQIGGLVPSKAPSLSSSFYSLQELHDRINSR